MTKILQLFTSDAQLVRGLQNQDPKTQRHVFDKYSPRFLAVCVRYLPDRMEAEDVMIEGFMKIFEKINQYKSEGSFEGWMRRLITNEALMRVRSNKQIWVSTDNEETHNTIADTVWADQNIEAEELMAIIARLPEGFRTVFNLYAIEGYSHAEIAEMLHISEGTSKSQLSRARAALQHQINAQTVANVGA